jgi:RNA polymerase sigma factor FliA
MMRLQMNDREKDRLVEANMPIVNKVVAQERRKLSVDKNLTDEMRSFALEGLARAMDGYDASRGITFRFYAEKRIRWAIYDGFRKMGWLPRGLRKKIKFYRQANEMLTENAKSPPPKDKVDAVHRLSERLKDLATAYFTTYAEELENEPASVPAEAESNLAKKQSSCKLRVLIQTLPEKERRVIIEYYFEDKKLSEIAEEMRITISWASKILSNGLKRLRKMMNDNPEILHSFIDESTL